MNKKIPLMLLPLIAFILYGILGTFGYGNDPDTYGMLYSGQKLWHGLGYEASRFQGSVVTEVCVGLGSLVGGFYLTNLLSALLGATTLFLFLQIAVPYLGEDRARWICALLAFNPWYIIACSSSMDYVYGFFFLILALWLALRQQWVLTALSLALTISARLSNLPLASMLAIGICIHLVKHERYHKVIAFCLVGFLATAALYFPVFQQAGYNLSFLPSGVATWSLKSIAARFIYKNIYLFGLIPFALLLVAAIQYLRRSTLPCAFPFTAVLLGWVAFVIQEYLFLKFPLEISYLIPLILLLSTLIWSKNVPVLLLKMMVLFTLLFNVVNLQILKIEYKDDPDAVEAINAHPSFFIEKGPVIKDVAERSASQRYNFKKYALPFHTNAIQ